MTLGVPTLSMCSQTPKHVVARSHVRIPRHATMSHTQREPALGNLLRIPLGELLPSPSFALGTKPDVALPEKHFALLKVLLKRSQPD